MAEINPPLYLDQDDAYGAAELGLPFRDIVGEGVVQMDDLLVSQDTGSDLKVSVAAGACWVKGDDDVNAQPTYRCRNDAAVLLQHDAADATNDRIDLIIAEVLDSAFSGVSKTWRLRIVKGTPAATPAAPALPGNAIALAEVTIGAGSGAVTNANIVDRRGRAVVGGGAALGTAPAVVETIADLGEAVDGKTGLLRLGASPYEYETVIYDAVAGKWVTPTYSWNPQVDATTGGTYAAVTNGFVIGRYKARYDAGLRLEVRWSATLSNGNGSGGRTVSGRIRLSEIAEGAASIVTPDTLGTMAAISASLGASAAKYVGSEFDGGSPSAPTKEYGVLYIEGQDGVGDGGGQITGVRWPGGVSGSAGGAVRVEWRYVSA